MKIVSVEAIPFVLPYARDFRMASGVITEAAHVLVRVATDEGLTGVAEAVSRPMIYGESQESIVAAVRHWLGPGLVGLDPFALEEASGLLDTVAANNTARGALDIALHDIRGQALNVPTWRLLGSAAPDIRVTCMIGSGSAPEMAFEAGRAADEHGIDSFKLKISADVAASVAAVTSVREQVGDRALLYLDANQSLTVEAAVEIVDRVASLRIEFVEEPVPAEDYRARAQFAARCTVPILADESARSAREAARELTAGAAGALSVKTARTGFTESARVLGLARGLNRRAIIGSQGDSAIGAISACSFAAAYAQTAAEPAELHFFATLKDQIVASPPAIRGGRIAVDQARPGNGVEIDEEKLAHYRTDR